VLGLAAAGQTGSNIADEDDGAEFDGDAIFIVLGVGYEGVMPSL
jgi:hypothetical protein